MGNCRDKFVRLAESRTTRILKEISLLSNLANRSNYSYDSNDVKKIFGALTAELKDAQNRFEVNLKIENKNDFKL